MAWLETVMLIFKFLTLINFMNYFISLLTTLRTTNTNARAGLLLLALLLSFSIGLNAQENNAVITTVLEEAVNNNEITEEDAAEWNVKDEHVSSISGVMHSYFRQNYQGLEIVGSESSVHTLSDNTLLTSHNHFVNDVAQKIAGPTSPGFTAIEAVEQVASTLGLQITEPLTVVQDFGGVNQKVVLSNGGISVENIPAKLVYQLNENGMIELSWDVSIHLIDYTHWWSIRVNAQTGTIIQQQDWVTSCDWGDGDHSSHNCADHQANKNTESATEAKADASLLIGAYNVYPMPVESPGHGARALISNPDDAIASPFGWHDLNGAPGSETTNTSGNNVDAFENDDNPGFRPDGTAALNFDFPINTTWSSGDQSEAAVITNLFYWNNIIHDVWYQYGFDEASGNFQENNYGNGGLGSDRVNARAQIQPFCNATMGTPGDGGNPTMTMGVCGSRDGDLDNAVIVHEYTHGISNRLTGGPGNSGCLSNQEQMGEGWSDWYGIVMTIEPGDAGVDARGIGSWLFGQGPNGPGIRPFPYSTDLTVNPQTYNDIQSASVPHGVGSVWSTMLWEVTWALIDQYGYDADFYTGTGGNNIAMALVTEGMKLQPCSPGFVDGRDAILAADMALFAGANQCLIWEAFAKRGLGFDANQGSSASRSDGTEGFELPPACLAIPPCDVAIVNITVTPLTCGDEGVIVVTATSSNPPIAYSISGPVNTTNATGTFNGLPAGTYSVLVTDASPTTPCEDTGMATLVGDTTPPVITCPPSQVLSCFETLPTGIVTGMDFIAAGGTISDNCPEPYTVYSQTTTNGGDNCPGNGLTATRTYYVADQAGNTTTCTQTFTYLESTQGPVVTSILPTCFKYCASLANPMDTDITYDTDCSYGGTVIIAGPQQIGAANCPGSIYRYTYSVTDDCGRTSAAVTRDFVIGNDGPTIECAPFNLLLECGDPNNADYIAAHIATATANSSCELGVNINHFPQNFNNITCNTSTVVTFVATDDCGRSSTCTTTINISDNTAPVITSTYVDGVCNEAVCGSNVSFWFNSWKSKVLEGLSATDACDSNVSFSTAGSPNSATQDCPDGTAETVVTWLANDNCGNQGEISYSFYVVSADAPAPSPAIMGMVATEQTETVENVSITLEGNGLSIFDVTAANGMYGFENLVEGQNYSVTPLLDENPLNGVSSFDLVLISKHILQLEQLDSPYKIIAADINHSGSVTTMDMVELRKLILHIDDDFANNTSWRFVEAAYVFPTPTNPFATVFPEEVNINGLAADEEHDFVGVKIGDVNGSAVANQFAQAEDRSAVDELVFEIENQKVVVGQTVDVTFRSDNFNAIHGYQFSLGFDQAVLQFNEVQTGTLANLNEDNFGLALLDNGVITTSWTNNKAQTAMRAADLFTISFIAKADGQLRDLLTVNSSFTKAEAYNGNLDLMDVQMRFDAAVAVTNELRLYQNMPNPFKQETLIGFELPEAGAATLNIYDVSGKLLKQIEGEYAKGYNSISLSEDGLSPGLLHYQLIAEAGIKTRKMLFSGK
jgi:hypothetical protein